MSMHRRNYYGEDIAGPTWLYRLYAANDDLVYVGVSSDPKSRFTTHRYQKAWWQLVDRVDLMWYSTRSQAFEAERDAIINESPIYNVARPKRVVA